MQNISQNPELTTFCGEISEMPVSEIMKSQCALTRELTRRGVIRTKNIVGDLAETLFARTFDWKLEPCSNAAFDAVDMAGNRYQIKARQCVGRVSSLQFSAIRDLFSDSFDYLAFIIFNEDFSIRFAGIMTRNQLIPLCRHQEHTNADNPIIPVGKDKLAAYRDVTDQVVATYEQL